MAGDLLSFISSPHAHSCRGNSRLTFGPIRRAARADQGHEGFVFVASNGLGPGHDAGRARRTGFSWRARWSRGSRGALGALFASLSGRSCRSLTSSFSLRPLRADRPLRPRRADLASRSGGALRSHRPLLSLDALWACRSCGTCRSGWARRSCRALWARRRLAAREKRQSHRDRHDAEQLAHGCLPFRTVNTGRGITLDLTPISKVTMVELPELSAPQLGAALGWLR